MISAQQTEEQRGIADAAVEYLEFEDGHTGEMVCPDRTQAEPREEPDASEPPPSPRW